jgi:hypothetical protein
MDYDIVNDLYRLPKAPELIKELHSVAAEVFYDSTDDYAPIWFDSSALSYIYGGQLFFDVANNRNMFLTSEEVTGDCLTNVYEFINYTP